MKKIIFVVSIAIIPLLAIINPVIDNQGYKYGGRAVLPFAVTNSTSDWILIPENTESTSVSLSFASNQARVEYSLVPYPGLTNTTHFYVWPLGTISSNRVDVLTADVIALRVVALTNITKAYFVFKRKLP